MFDRKMTNLLQTAFLNTYTALQEQCHEHFYFAALVLDSGSRPYFSAWSYEAYERSIRENRISAEEQAWWNWNLADSLYIAFEDDTHFAEFSQKADADKQQDYEWNVLIDSMLEALLRIRKKHTDHMFDNVILNVAVFPPDEKEADRALQCNSPSDLLQEYLHACEPEPAGETESIDWNAVWNPPRCQVILTKPVTDKKMAAGLRRDFTSMLGLGEFLRSCRTVPFVIQNDFLYKTALQIVSEHAEYSDAVQLNLIKKEQE